MGRWTSANSNSRRRICCANACPWGQEFAAPLFDGRFIVKSTRVLKTQHTKLILTPNGSDIELDAIAFGQIVSVPTGEQITAVYRLSVNTYRQRRQLQLQILYTEQ